MAAARTSKRWGSRRTRKIWISVVGTLAGVAAVTALGLWLQQRRETDLVVGSFGRGIYLLDAYSAMRDIAGVMTMARPAALNPWSRSRRLMSRFFIRAMRSCESILTSLCVISLIAERSSRRWLLVESLVPPGTLPCSKVAPSYHPSHRRPV